MHGKSSEENHYLVSAISFSVSDSIKKNIFKIFVTFFFHYSGPWDLEVSSNVYTAEPQTPRHDILPPHPQIEQLRGQLMVKLRLCYQQACKSREQIDSPKESLNR